MVATNNDPLAEAIRFWPVLIVSILAVALAVGGLSTLDSPTWTSTAKVIYGRDSSGLLTGAVTSDSDITRTLATQTQVVLSDPVIKAAAEQLDLKRKTLLKASSVNDLTDSDVITISVTAASATDSVRRTNAVANSYVEYTKALARDNLARQADSLQASIKDLRKQLAQAPPSEQGNSSPLSTALSALVQRQGQLTSAASAEEGAASLIAAPILPTAPRTRSLQTSAAVGAGLGTVLGIGLMLLLGRVSTVRGKRRDRRAGSPTSAELPRPPRSA